MTTLDQVNTGHEDDVAATETGKLSFNEIDKLNMDSIEDYINKVHEYEATGQWTGFMGVKFNTWPPEPVLLTY